jgi:hypothetical protein
MRENPNMSGTADRQTNVGRESKVGWHEAVPPNGFVKRPRSSVSDTNDNPAGLAAVANELETTPEHYNLVAGDPTVVGWTRSYDDPNVVALRERLDHENGIPDLELVESADVDRAVELFDRDGFVAVGDALDSALLERMRAAVDRVVDRLIEVDPDNSVGGGAGGLPHRYSFGSSSATRHMLHVPEWCELVDLPTTTPILTAIFGSPNYLLGGGGGDMALPGAIEYQGLHSDNLWEELPDRSGRVSVRDLPVPVVTINFPMIDFTRLNGPVRQVPGTQNSREPIPSLAAEPGWMKLSTVCPVPAGSAIIRDNRTWHGGTPNLSRDVRAMPNIEYFAPWFRSEGVIRSMPFKRWQELSPHGRRISRHVMLGAGERLIGEGFIHPKRAEREAFRAQQLEELGTEQAQEYLERA